MNFIIISRNSRLPTSGINTAYLTIDGWNDYSFVTMFYLTLYDDKGLFHDLGNVKIGFQGQTTEKSTHSTLSTSFTQLSSEYFSLGQDVEYYKKISLLPSNIGISLLDSLNDIVRKSTLIDLHKDEEVFGTSLLRGVSLSVIRGQFSRVLEGYPPLTNFEFKFLRPETEEISSIELRFKVTVESKPSTNIHAIIWTSPALLDKS